MRFAGMNLLSRASPSHDRTAGGVRALALLAAAMVLSMTTWFSASAVLPQLRVAWALSSTEAALLTVAVQLGFVTGALVSAVTNLPDRIPARRVFFAASVGAATVNGLVAACHGPATTLPLRFATGCFVAGIYPPALKVMATWFRRGRGLALGVMVGALTVGSALPHLINGIGGLPWQLVVVTASASTLLGGVIVLLLVHDGPFRFPPASFEPRYVLRAFADPAVRLALAMAVSGTCAASIGLTFGRSLWLVLGVGVLWGIAVVADSAQFSAMVTELADQAYVGTALTVQLAVGFSLTVVTIWLVPLLRDAVTWRWAFAALAPGPLLGVAAMLRLRARPESGRIAHGRG
jgi:MFS family permease